MDERVYRFLTGTAVILTLAFAGWTVYGYFVESRSPGDYDYAAGAKYFADGEFSAAIRAYENTIAEVPDHYPARIGRAETLIMLGREHEAIAAYESLIAEHPHDARLYANRGIAYDRSGSHERALADYETALRLDAEAVEGPGWLTRFLRNQPEKPPAVADRARYLREQLALPQEQRLLSLPVRDAEQRPFKN